MLVRLSGGCSPSRGCRPGSVILSASLGRHGGRGADLAGHSVTCGELKASEAWQSGLMRAPDKCLVVTHPGAQIPPPGPFVSIANGEVDRKVRRGAPFWHAGIAKGKTDPGGRRMALRPFRLLGRELEPGIMSTVRVKALAACKAEWVPWMRNLARCSSWGALKSTFISSSLSWTSSTVANHGHSQPVSRGTI